MLEKTAASVNLLPATLTKVAPVSNVEVVRPQYPPVYKTALFTRAAFPSYYLFQLSVSDLLKFIEAATFLLF